MRLKELREEKGLTQEAVAKAIGVSSISYLHYEKGQRKPPLNVIFALASYYGVTTDYLLAFEPRKYSYV
ncbi:transcriptional regulator [Clostridia bacterium]|nr:transcriptional regulator [Clostridia bacterium]